MRFVNTIKQHLQNPLESTEQYLKRKRLSLADENRSASKIYLDTKFWVTLRNARLGRPVGADNLQLLSILETLVSRRKAICPISVDTFVEVFKQSDPITLRATVQLIDDLSGGIALIESMERVQLEFLHFLREKSQGSAAVHAIPDLVWTKTAYVLGFVTPSLAGVPSVTETVIQKAFIDQMWEMSLTDILDQVGEDTKNWRGISSAGFSQQLNESKFSHMHEYSSFEELFMNEVAGAIDVMKPMFADGTKYLYQTATGDKLPVEEQQQVNVGRITANLIYHAFKMNKITTELASIRVGAGLHAVVRWDAKRKYKDNDLHDFHHAVAAIPYCDWFLTEHSLRHLVGDKNLRFSSLFGCRTISDPSEAVSALSPLAA